MCVNSKGSSEPSLVAYVISTITHELAQLTHSPGAYSNLIGKIMIDNYFDFFLF